MSDDERKEERSVEPTVGDERPETLARLHHIQEQTIRKGLTKFKEVGAALLWIRDHKTYKSVENFETFEAYCREKWDMVASRGRQLISAAEASQNLAGVTMVTLVNERQARLLMGLTQEQQCEAWRRAVEKAEGERPTGRQVAQVVKAIKEETDKGRQDSGKDDTSPTESPTAKLEGMTSQLAKQGKKMLQTLTSIENLLEEHGQVEGLGPLAEALHGVHERVDFLMKKLGAPKVADSPQPRQLALE